MRKKAFVTLLVVTVLAVIFLWTTTSPLRAQSDSGISQTLSRILENQREIISHLTEIKAELSKIKFRIR